MARARSHSSLHLLALETRTPRAPAARGAMLAMLFGVALGLGGCGSSDDTGGAPSTDKCKAAGTTYPTTGCGTEVGTVIANYTFTGRLKGTATPTATTFRLSDFYDPTGSKGNRYLVINVSALWCAYCKEEAKSLLSFSGTYGPKGVVFMTDLAQKLDSSPADQGDVSAWIDTYKLDTAVVNDPSFVLGAAFFNPAQMPLNLIIDLKTMTILQKSLGLDYTNLSSELDKLLGT